MGVAAVPQRAGAVADQDDDPASGRIAEPVGGVQRRTVRVGAAADGRAPVRALVQMADLDVREGAQPAEDLGQFGEEPAPHAHRGGGVQDQLQPGVAAGQVPADGQDQPARPGAQLRGADLVEHGAQRCGRAAVALQGAQGTLEFERRGQDGGGRHPHRQRAGAAGSGRTGPVAGGQGVEGHPSGGRGVGLLGLGRPGLVPRQGHGPGGWPDHRRREAGVRLGRSVRGVGGPGPPGQPEHVAELLGVRVQADLPQLQDESGERVVGGHGRAPRPGTAVAGGAVVAGTVARRLVGHRVTSGDRAAG